MESVAISGVVQTGKLVLQQVGVTERSVDECRTQHMLAVEVRLIDSLVRAPVGRFIGSGRRIVVGDHAVKVDRPRTLDRQAPTGIDGNVIAAQAWRIELQRATAAPVIAGRGLGTMAQVDARAIGQGQLALA